MELLYEIMNELWKAISIGAIWLSFALITWAVMWGYVQSGSSKEFNVNIAGGFIICALATWAVASA